MTAVRAVSTALPPHRLSQSVAAETARRVHAGRGDLLKLLRVFQTSGVEERRLAFPAEYYATPRSFDDRNRDFIREGLALAETAARSALDRARVRPQDIDHLYVVTTTGLATPSLDALLVGRLGLRGDVRRWPLFGLGCAGGAGALTRACDAGGLGLVVAVELCGQVFSTRAAQPTDVIGAALFGDGAAAAVVGPGPGPRIVARKSVIYEGTQHLMGWSFTSDGMRLLLSKEVTDFIGERLKPVIGEFLASANISQNDIAHWVLHPGGRRIIETYHEAFGLGEHDLRWTRGSLARVGNLSSASILFILADLIDSGAPKPGDRGLLCALGPGFASELLLLEW